MIDRKLDRLLLGRWTDSEKEKKERKKERKKDRKGVAILCSPPGSPGPSEVQRWHEPQPRDVNASHDGLRTYMGSSLS